MKILLQGIFLTQVLNLVLPHCRQTLYCLSQIIERKGLRIAWAKEHTHTHHTYMQSILCSWAYSLFTERMLAVEANQADQIRNDLIRFMCLSG